MLLKWKSTSNGSFSIHITSHIMSPPIWSIALKLATLMKWVNTQEIRKWFPRQTNSFFINTPELERKKPFLLKPSSWFTAEISSGCGGGEMGSPVWLNHVVWLSQCPARGSRAQHLGSVSHVRALLLGDSILHLMENALDVQKHPDDNSLSL